MRARFSRAALAALIVAAACGGASSTSPTPGGTTGGSSGGAGGTTGGGNSTPVSTNAVTVNNDFFTPPAITVPVGTTVTWTWSQDAITHNVTFADGTTSGDKTANATYSRQFSSAGTFTYRCTIHAGMTGTVTVQ
jgi:plastocyanin